MLVETLLPHRYPPKIKHTLGDVYEAPEQHARLLQKVGLVRFEQPAEAYQDRNSVPETIQAEQKPVKRGRGRPRGRSRKRRDMKAESDQ